MDISVRNARRAYVLDDEPGIRTAVCRVLNRSGFHAEAFSKAETLFSRLACEPSEFLVLDLSLGQSDAVEVIDHLAALSYRGRVLLISGHGHKTLQEIQAIGKMRGLAMLLPLSKPFRSSDIANRLSEEPEIDRTASRPSSQDAPKVDAGEALRKNYCEVWYQPKIDLRTNLVSGAEALLRVRHPVHGIVPPAGFLPPPNDPLYWPLSEFVIRQTARDWHRFSRLGFPLKLSVNVPASVIAGRDFTNFVREHLPTDATFPGLIVEVTEDEVVRNVELVKEVAARLKLYGVMLSIDDFGSGYSSLSRLFDLSFAEVKLDRSFVSGCGEDRLRASVCRTTVDLAQRFDAVVCAEGIETKEDWATLIDIGCDYGQGFLFAKPMPFEACADYLRVPIEPLTPTIRLPDTGNAKTG